MKSLRRAVGIGSLGVGLGTSLILVLEYSGGSSVCRIGGGCDLVQQSSLASIAGIPTPWFGVMFFALLIGLFAFNRPKIEVTRCAGIGAGVALLFLAVQAFWIGAFCKLCVIVDSSAILFFLNIAIGDNWLSTREKRAWGLGGGLVAGLVVVVVNVTASNENALSSAPLPVVGAQATIVEFVDFECPACRALHQELKETLALIDKEVRIVRKHVPLKQHAHAKSAARAYCCAQEAGVGEAMADRLFASNELNADTCEKLVSELSVDLDAYQECMSSERPDAILLSHAAEAKELKIRALPTIFVGTERFEGAPSRDRLTVSIRTMLEE